MAPAEWFRQVKSIESIENVFLFSNFFFQIPLSKSDEEKFKEGQKLEAVDPLEMSRICPATVGKVG